MIICNLKLQHIQQNVYICIIKKNQYEKNRHYINIYIIII